MHANATMRKSLVFGDISGMKIRVHAIISMRRPTYVDGSIRSRVADFFHRRSFETYRLSLSCALHAFM
jgi:hypothetical protein